MMSHFKVNSLAKAQMNKIERLLKKARGRHDVMLVGDRHPNIWIERRGN